MLTIQKQAQMTQMAHLPNNLMQHTRVLSHRQHGIAMMIVLWMLSLLSIIALAYSGMTRSESQMTTSLIHTSKARAQAEGAFWRAVNELVKPPNFRSWLQDGTPRPLSSSTPGAQQGDRLLISIQDETGKIDINKASQIMLRGVFNSINEDTEQNHRIVDGILDWRDRDNVKKDNGAEDKDYADAGANYGAKDGPMNHTGELLKISGMTQALFDKVKPLVTVHSMQARVRLTTAPVAVLKALPGMTDELLAQILTSRSDAETAILPALPNILKPLVFSSGTGNVFTITSEARIENALARLRVTILLKRTGNRPITIIDWKETAPPLIQTQSETLVSQTL